MNFEFLNNIPRFGVHANKDTGTKFMSTTALLEIPKNGAYLDIKLWGCSILSFLPWFINPGDKIQVPSLELKRHAHPSGAIIKGKGNSNLRFRPYVSRVPWHTGARAFLSQLFPRYGHYCGPNWSSGKDGGSLLWDKRPIDWLDFCCYCHDIGYDTHDQAELLKADLAFLECLEMPSMSTKGDPHIARLYKTMCTSANIFKDTPAINWESEGLVCNSVRNFLTCQYQSWLVGGCRGGSKGVFAGLRNILIPYRTHLLRLQSVQLSVGFGWLSNMKWRG